MVRAKQTARKSTGSAGLGSGGQLRAQGRTQIANPLPAIVNSGTGRRLKSKSSNKKNPVIIDDDDDDDDIEVIEDHAAIEDQGPPTKKQKVESNVKKRIEKEIKEVEPKVGQKLEKEVDHHIISLLAKRYKVIISHPAKVDKHANTPGFPLTIRAPPTKPEQPSRNMEITTIECGMMYDSNEEAQSFPSVGGLPVFTHMWMDTNDQITGFDCLAGGQTVLNQESIWLYPEWDTGPKRAKRRSEVQQRHDEWKVQAMAAYRENLILWKIKRICWETLMIKELAKKGRSEQVQWQEGADPRWVRHKKPIDIMKEAVLIHFGEVADDRRWPRRNKVRQASRKEVAARTPVGISAVEGQELSMLVSSEKQMMEELEKVLGDMRETDDDIPFPVRKRKRPRTASERVPVEQLPVVKVEKSMEARLTLEIKLEMDLAGDQE